jgi:hypothetical protein
MHWLFLCGVAGLCNTAATFHLHFFKNPLPQQMNENLLPLALRTIQWAWSHSVFFSFLALQSNLGLCRLHETFRFTSVTLSRTVGRTPWTRDQLVARPLPVHKHRKSRTTQTLNIHALSGIRTHGSASTRAKTVHALDRWATVTGSHSVCVCKLQ